jgi:spermidine synthase
MINTIYDNDLYLSAVYRYNGINSSEFYGDVLYVGMGSGFMVKGHSDLVTSTTFIEIDEEVINKYRQYDWVVIKGDAYDVEVDTKFDFIIIDIWDKPTDKINIDHLINKFNNNLKGGEIKYLKSIIKRTPM